MDDEMRKIFRELNHEHLHSIWEKAKNGDLDDLDEEERRFAKAMIEHEDEFFNQFEMSDLLHDHEYDVDNEANPFLHISLHVVAETQLEIRDPIEVYQFYNAMRAKKCSHHDTIHLIGSIIAPLLISTLQQKKEFDLDRYRSLLKKCKNRNPDKIPGYMEKDFANLFSE
jgi:hypothetical protein